MKHKITDLQTRAIIVHESIANNQTHAEIGRMLNMDPSTIGKIVKRFRQRGTIENAPITGRPEIIRGRDGRTILREIAREPKQTKKELCQKVKNKVCVRTLTRFLEKKGYHTRKTVEKLTEEV
ncbi:hypothetical protein BDF14DRAFT_1749803 [Spinellus fusiger]|nr:hypothetical protein BDF14DRAFT_1749803 [Spinellus fusiger]